MIAAIADAVAGTAPGATGTEVTGRAAIVRAAIVPAVGIAREAIDRVVPVVTGLATVRLRRRRSRAPSACDPGERIETSCSTPSRPNSVP